MTHLIKHLRSIKNLFTCIACLITLFCQSAIADEKRNNTGYRTITEIKTWPTYIDIYLDEESQCTSWKHRKVYLLLKSDDLANYDEYYTILTAAMMSGSKVKLQYICDSNKGGKTVITGVRVRPN